MSLDSVHPLYSAILPDWVLMEDAYAGERRVKSKRTEYLPATSGQIADGMDNPNQPGYKSYEAYLTRARFPNFVREAVQTAIGMMHHNPPKIDLPPQLEFIRERATTFGESLEQLLRRINEQQLLTGRVGMLLDLPQRTLPGRDQPYVAVYGARQIRNWDYGAPNELTRKTLNLVILEESGFERDLKFNWVFKQRFRVLLLGNTEANEVVATYRTGLFSEEGGLQFSEAQTMTPNFRGRTLNQIPFTFVNSIDLLPDPDDPPLLDLGNLCMTIYRGEADYRQNLFMQGQDTLVITGSPLNASDDETVRVGAGSKIELPIGGDAKYIGVESDGLSEQREALEADRARAGSMGAQTLDTVSRERESGSSLQTRIAARTADLNQVAKAGAAALQQTLRQAAEWVGADPGAVTVEPNLDFGDLKLLGRDLVDFQAAKNQGYPLSARSLHQMAVEKGLSSMTFEEELAAIGAEAGTVLNIVKRTGDQNPDQSPGATQE